MTLLLEDDYELITIDFGNWLIQKIKYDIITKLDKSKLILWDQYLSQNSSLPKLYKKSYRAADLIICAANSLICKGKDGKIKICVDDNVLAPGFDRVKLIQLIKLINYGTLDTKGYPLIQNVFEDVAKNINTYVGVYYQL